MCASLVRFCFNARSSSSRLANPTQRPTRPNPTNIANANPNPPTPADRVIPVHSWRLVIVPCGLILCASLVRFCLNARSSSSSSSCCCCCRVCAMCGSEFKIMGLCNRLCKRFFAAVIVRTTAQADSRAQPAYITAFSCEARLVNVKNTRTDCAVMCNLININTHNKYN